jgi:hypothetical protein
MSVRKHGLDALEYELVQEQAATIGRLGRELRHSLDALEAYDKGAAGAGTAADRTPGREALLDAAAHALWHFVVQRECSGFGRTEDVLKDYAVPGAVRARMGAVRPGRRSVR